MEDNKLNILIIGKSLPLAKKLAKSDKVKQIFMTSGNSCENDIYTSVDIRDDDLTGLLKFCLENDINLTIPTSQLALKSDIVEFFQSNGQNIFGPCAKACEFAISKSCGKKLLYKIHAQTSRFGVFDKYQNALNYLDNTRFPILIKTDELNNRDDRLVCPTVSLAKEFLHNIFSHGDETVLIEEFFNAHNFTVYFITDGYSAIPVSTVANLKFMQDGDGGIYTNGMGCYSPDNKISSLVVQRVTNIVDNVLKLLDNQGTPYMGILGVEGVLTGEDKFLVTEFKPFLQSYDSQVVLTSIEDDLTDLFMSCIQGLFSDEYEQIQTNDLTSVSAVILSKQAGQKVKNLSEIDGIELLNIKHLSDDNYVTQLGESFIITKTASTLSRAVKNLYDDLEQIKFNGMKYRKDIGISVIIE